MTLPPLENSDHVVVLVSINFQSNYNLLCSSADWDGLLDHLRDAPWEDIFKPSASAAAHEFCELFQVEIDVCIPHRKCQVKPHPSPWFSAACAAAIVHRNRFFLFVPTE